MRKIRLMIVALLAMVLVFGVGSAMASDAILFPYFATGGGNVTFFKIINTADPTSTAANAAGRLKYVYYYNTDREVCEHVDLEGSVTMNDMVFFEASNTYRQPLLPGESATAAPTLSTSATVRWGSLGVKHYTGFATSGLEGTLFGQAYVVNVPTGTAFAYNAINDPDEDSEGSHYFEENAADQYLISFLPTTYTSTVYYFFPVEFSPVEGSDFFDEIADDEWIETGAEDRDGQGVGRGQYGWFDNNETFISGWRELPVGCHFNRTDTRLVKEQFFFYTLDELMNSEQFARLKLTGGFTTIEWDDYGYAYKFETTNVLGRPMSIMLYEPQLEALSSYTK